MMNATACLAVLTAALTISMAEAAGDRALGEYLSSECVTCHQLTGKHEGIPPIIGWPEQSFVEIMGEYRNKKRSNPIMQTIAGRFSTDEIAALAAYFGGLKSRN
jgi:cytochrome c553